jgi:hypothetical protein
MQTGSMHSAITRAWDLALSGTPILYLSGPISTGPRFVQKLRSGEASSRVLAGVRKHNSEDILAAAKRLRQQRSEVVIEPASLELRDWTQPDYHRLWRHLIEHHAKAVVFMPGWEYSVGCAIEFGHAARRNIRMETLAGSPLSVDDGVALLEAAEQDLRSSNANGSLLALADKIRAAIASLDRTARTLVLSEALRKDESLEFMAARGMNVAQFVSFTPERGRPHLAFVRLCDWNANNKASIRSILEALLERSSDRSVNVRSYEPHDSKSREFIYGIKSVDQAVEAVNRLSGEGLHTIVNETIDVRDGGVSGVLMGNIVEFSPDDTPRCVEKPGTASLPRGIGRDVLATVYDLSIDFPVPFASRLEFSVHPRPRGWRRMNLVMWEFSEDYVGHLKPEVKWPNNFSRMIGDKAFGLLVADQFGLPVPHTTVINRRIAPFSFGRDTGWSERWLRTAPPEQVPGLFTTHRGWIDPFFLLREEDPEGAKISSVLSQAGVYPAFSGALVVSANGGIIIEGLEGAGDTLMIGQSEPERLPKNILEDVREIYLRAETALGAVRFEWVHDGKRVWLVQFHRGATESTDIWITPGEAEAWVEFDVKAGLPALREALSRLPPNAGLLLNGRVGLTSHLADVLRKARIPARMKH